MGPDSCEATRHTGFGDIFNVPRTVHVETAAIVANSSPLTQPTLKACSKGPRTKVPLCPSRGRAASRAAGPELWTFGGLLY